MCIRDSYGALGDYLNSDSQTDKAGVAFQQAEALLTIELEKLEVQQGQQNFIQFVTYGTTYQTTI